MSLWSEPSRRRASLEAARGGHAHLEAVDRLKDWTRERFGLGAEDTVMVAEHAGTLPGFPPLLTGVAFWTADGTRYAYRVFKRAEDVALADIPPSWMRPALEFDGFDCECC